MGKILIIGLVVLLFSGCSKTKISKPKKISNRNIKISTEMRNEQRVALIIGNNEYKGNLSKLSNPINDARAIRDILKTRGFEVMYIENTSEKAMKKSIKDFSRKIKNGGVGVFYFSGHGIEVDGENYLIPTDADIKEKSETESEAISLTKITNRMQNTNNRLNIIILDACRNNPFSRAMGSGGLSKIEPRGLFVSYSTEAGKTASDGRVGGNGLFTKHLINYMKVPGLNLTDMFKKTRESVFIESNEKQFPAIYDQTIAGDFYFTLPQTYPKPQEAESAVPNETIPIKKDKPIISSTKIKKKVQTSTHYIKPPSIEPRKTPVIGDAIVSENENEDTITITIPNAIKK